MLFQVVQVRILCGRLHFVRLVDQYIKPGAVQVALNERVELLLVHLQQLMDRTGECVQKAVTFVTVGDARPHGVFALDHSLGRFMAIGVPSCVRAQATQAYGEPERSARRYHFLTSSSALAALPPLSVNLAANSLAAFASAANGVISSWLPS